MVGGNIRANYVPDGDDWVLTVSTDSGSKTARTSDLIAAREKADELIEELAPGKSSRTVVHLLDGDGFAFSTAYLQARHGLSDEATAEAVAHASENADSSALPMMPPSGGSHRA